MLLYPFYKAWGALGLRPPWISEIYGFQAVIRPQWVLSPTPQPPEKKLSPTKTNS